MTFADFQPLIQSVIALAAAVMTGLIALYVPKAIAAFERRTGIQLTDQQRAAVRAAADTQAGIVETMLQQGAIKLADVTPGNPVMIQQAEAALARVPVAAKAQGTTPSAMAAVIVGQAETAPKPPSVLVVPQALPRAP